MFIFFFYSHLHTAPCFLSPNLTSHSSSILTPFNYGLWNPHYVANKQTNKSLLKFLLWHFSTSCFNWSVLSCGTTTACLKLMLLIHPHISYPWVRKWEVSILLTPQANPWPLLQLSLETSLAHLELRIFGSLPNILITLPQALGTWIYHSVFLPISSPATIS